MKYISNLKSKIMSYNIIKKESFIKYVLFCILTIIYLIISGMVYDDRIYISANIEIMIPILAKTKYEDTHGGFHGDGHAIGIVYLTKNQTNRVLNQIKKNKHWKELPINKIIVSHLYNNMYNYNINYCPELIDIYWYFYDWHSKATDRYDIEAALDIEKRFSFNYVAAIFDKNHQKLIYYELDT